jgi:MoxR-like ATPase
MWERILERWALSKPDERRVERAEKILGEGKVRPVGPLTWKVNTYEVRVTGGVATCTCPDFQQRQRHKGQACKHIVAACMWFAANQAPEQPPEEIGAIIEAIIEELARRIVEALKKKPLLLLSGPTGSGKTSAIHKAVLKLGWGLEEIVGSESWTDSDLIGSWTPQRKWVCGPIGRAFRRARGGEKVVVFIDEVTRFSPRALDVLMRAVQPIEADIAKAQGLEVEDGEVYIVESPLLGVRLWAPAENIIWIAAGNPGVNPLDPALVRRFPVLLVRLDRRVLEPLPGELKAFVEGLWESYEAGELPLPLEYQALSEESVNIEALIEDYIARLEVLDPIAAKAVRTLAEGHGFLRRKEK